MLPIDHSTDDILCKAQHHNDKNDTVHKNDTVDVSSSAYHSMSKWANQCKRSFQGNENEADDRSGNEHCLKCGGNIPVLSILGQIAVKKWYSICSDCYCFCEADEQIRYSQVN